MNQAPTLTSSARDPGMTRRSPLVEIVEVASPKGEWLVPAIQDVSLALALSDHSAQWRDHRGFRSQAVSAGNVAICQFNKSRAFEMKNAAQFAVVLLRNEALEQVRQESRPNLGAELHSDDTIQDSTLRRLIEILLQERRDGYPDGVLFLDGVATALASHLVGHYSTAVTAERKSIGGMAPCALRRCTEFMDAHLADEIRLRELAHEAGISTSHLVRSFRQSTGKTPYQFLLDRRVQRAQTLMRDQHRSLHEVAKASGFANQHHLARVFRRFTGATPSSYRRGL
jgi:AraC family transcriptional regulator